MKQHLAALALFCISCVCAAQAGGAAPAGTNANSNGATAGAAPFNVIQAVSTNGTQNVGPAKSIVVPVTSTTAGNLLLIYLIAQNGSPTYPQSQISSISGEAAGTHCPSDPTWSQLGGSNGDSVDCWYVLAATGGSTSITVNYTNANAHAGVAVGIIEVHRSSGTWSFDTAGVHRVTTTATTGTGPALTLSGTNDFVLNWVSLDNNGQMVSSVGSPFSPVELGFTYAVSGASGGSAHNLNATSGAGATFTF